ncbi:MAG: hypothetical protein KGL90_05065 [Burkholderiales bacterium]|nr:hypothetical protein [Burkholderiales bacterium]
MTTTSFTIDPKTDQTLERLKQHYGVATKAEVLRKAIALLNVAARHEQPDGSLIICQGSHDLKIVMR